MSQDSLSIKELLELPEEQQCSAETLQKLSTEDLVKLLKNYNMDEAKVEELNIQVLTNYNIN